MLGPLVLGFVIIGAGVGVHFLARYTDDEESDQAFAAWLIIAGFLVAAVAIGAA